MIDQKERLKKLYALAMRGVGGEKETAAAILAKLTKKYGISLDDLDEEQVKNFDLEFHGEIERKLLLQIVYKVTGDASNYHSLTWTASGRPCRTQARVYCTEAQKLEIEFLHDFYKRLWKKETEALYGAFIQKHRLFGEPKEGDQPAEISDEDYEKMCRLMRGLSDDQPLKLIEGGTV